MYIKWYYIDWREHIYSTVTFKKPSKDYYSKMEANIFLIYMRNIIPGQVAVLPVYFNSFIIEEILRALLNFFPFVWKKARTKNIIAKLFSNISDLNVINIHKSFSKISFQLLSNCYYCLNIKLPSVCVCGIRHAENKNNNVSKNLQNLFR